MNFMNLKKQDTAVFSHCVFTSCLALAWSLSVAVPAQAQQGSALSAVYGRGVHAYFAGNMSQAEQLFTQVIQVGSTDPRPYYYRAMLRLGQGRTFEAENDMRVGASYEARNPSVQHSIGRALQRVQGPGRRTLEQFRRQARLDRLQQSQQQSRQRYQQLDRRGPAVLRRAAPLPLEQPIQPPRRIIAPGANTPDSTVQPIPAGSGAKEGSGTKAGSGSRDGSSTKDGSEMKEGSGTRDGSGSKEGSGMKEGSGTKNNLDDPFDTPAPVTPEDDPFGNVPAAPTPASAPTPEPAEAGPFDTLPSPEPAAADADPFGNDDATPAPAPAAEETPQPEMADDDAFGDDAFGDDAFGDDAVEAEPAKEATEAPAEADDSDPFGDGSADEKAEEEPIESEAPAEAAEEAPAEETTSEDDPFGEDSAAADDSDPFGESSESAADEASTEGDDPFGDESSDDKAEDSVPAEESSEPADDDSAPADDASTGDDSSSDEASSDEEKEDPFDF
ncbi:MAG: hypothetical protein GXP24_11010 [Planctomycetes bacterium]|nr:hypothetical protein [Planctomycetota bacterium]